MTAVQTNLGLAQTVPAPKSTLLQIAAVAQPITLTAQELMDKVLLQTARMSKVQACTMLVGTPTRLATSISQCTTLPRLLLHNPMVRLLLTRVTETILILARASIQLALLQ